MLGTTLGRKISVGVLAVSVLSLAILGHSVYAADASQNIAVTPSSTEFSISPGDTADGSFDAINEGTIAFGVEFSSSPYYVKGLDYDPQFTQLPGTVNASKWIHFKQDTKQVLSGKKLTSVDYTVTVPAGTPAGGYYAVLFTETSPVSNNNGVVSHNRVGDILYITVKGIISSGGTITAEHLPLLDVDNTIPLNVIISNTGGTHFITKAEIGVTNLLGKTVYTAVSTRYVLPQTKRLISNTWSTTSPIGVYKVIRSATIAGKVKTLAPVWIFVIQRWVVALVISIIIIGIAALLLRSNRKHS